MLYSLLLLFILVDLSGAVAKKEVKVDQVLTGLEA
jgi:hypothetical protein